MRKNYALKQLNYMSILYLGQIFISPIKYNIMSKLRSLVNKNIFKHHSTYSTLHYTLIIVLSILSLCNILMRQDISRAIKLVDLDYNPFYF